MWAKVATLVGVVGGLPLLVSLIWYLATFESKADNIHEKMAERQGRLEEGVIAAQESAVKAQDVFNQYLMNQVQLQNRAARDAGVTLPPSKTPAPPVPDTP